jgi:hypothetical protein
MPEVRMRLGRRVGNLAGMAALPLGCAAVLFLIGAAAAGYVVRQQWDFAIGRADYVGLELDEGLLNCCRWKSAGRTEANAYWVPDSTRWYHWTKKSKETDRSTLRWWSARRHSWKLRMRSFAVDGSSMEPQEFFCSAIQIPVWPPLVLVAAWTGYRLVRRLRGCGGRGVGVEG